VKLTLTKGRKGNGDTLVLLEASKEPLTFSQLLFILKHYFESEDSYYSPSSGFDGKAYLMKAIIDVYSGVPFEKVLKRYNLENKLNIVGSAKPIEKLHEILE